MTGCRWALATAFVAQPLQNAASVTDITIGGHPGKRIELSVPDEVDLAACGPDEYRRWYFEGDPANSGPILWGKDQHDVVPPTHQATGGGEPDATRRPGAGDEGHRRVLRFGHGATVASAP